MEETYLYESSPQEKNLVNTADTRQQNAARKGILKNGLCVLSSQHEQPIFISGFGIYFFFNSTQLECSSVPKTPKSSYLNFSESFFFFLSENTEHLYNSIRVTKNKQNEPEHLSFLICTLCRPADQPPRAASQLQQNKVCS